ncbi:type II toxin-antitoxin system HicB family antitoxin [Desulfonema magnum]|uniref:Toxin-antitoxin system, antitoxin component, HicB-like n=1 Tax=Desulfonema magnum TaxID=45655 RepID=A0A975BP80_9BACT|nr:type II toxin-antitoxin system HicB family antitoxin [Desulfonema magnum]QTA88818.1 Toxin-antitoxin system, antitoxin component, HicB-like [Desulfonema magnum]
MAYYMVVIEKGEGNFSAYSPDVPGCVTTGKTLEETLENMKDALAFHLEGLCEDGDPLPEPRDPGEHLGEINISAGDVFTFVHADPGIFANAA